jgi:hypothetical protein
MQKHHPVIPGTTRIRDEALKRIIEFFPRVDPIGVF